VAQYYETWCEHWETVYNDMMSGCAGNALTGSQITDPEPWFAEAIQTHVADTAGQPQRQELERPVDRLPPDTAAPLGCDSVITLRKPTSAL
jgi:hypothetical protein